MTFGARRVKFRKPPLSNDSPLWLWLTDQTERVKGYITVTHSYWSSNGQLREAWDKHREPVLKWWIVEHPGTRPVCWWLFDAPEPRRRLGGVGTPLHVVFVAVEPSFLLGVPRDWEDDVDLKKPPLFESQAAFLRRHKLLTKEEARKIATKEFDPEPVTDIFDFDTTTGDTP